MARIPLPVLSRLLLPVLLAAASCSVLEDRDPCPCRLSLTVSGPGGQQERSAPIVLSVQEPDRSLLRREGLPLSVFDRQTPYRIEVPKRQQLAVSGVFGLSGNLAPDAREIRIPEGHAADSLWFFSERVDTQRETLDLPVRLRKEYAGIEIAFAEAIDNPEGTFPYFIRLRGESSGLDLFSGAPLHGAFSCRPRELAPGVYQSTLPRQRPTDSLVLELWPRESGKAEDEGPADRISLDAFIAETRGFSWQDEDLKDLEILIDYARAQLQIIVRDWDSETDPYFFSI